MWKVFPVMVRLPSASIHTEIVRVYHPRPDGINWNAHTLVVIASPGYLCVSIEQMDNRVNFELVCSFWINICSYEIDSGIR